MSDQPAEKPPPTSPEPVAPARRDRWRALLLNLALVAGSVFVAGVVAEAAVRVVMPQQLILIRPDIWQAVDSVGYVHRANVNTSVNTGERTVRFVTDRDGCRVARTGRVEGAKSVLLLGDSFMEALQVEHEQSLPGLLEARLPSVVGARVAVRNAANGGWGPDQYLIRTRTLLARDAYDLVIVALYVGNDAVPFRTAYIPPRIPVERYRFRIPASLSWGGLVDAIARPINDMLEVRSHLYVLMKNQMQTWRMRVGLTQAYFPVVFRTSDAASPRWLVTGELCRDIAAAAAVYDVPVLFVLVPTSYQTDPAAFSRYVRGFDIDLSTVDLEQPTRLIGDALRGWGLQVIDVLSEFRERRAAEPATPLFGSVDAHLSPAGHDLLAELVLPSVAAALGTVRHPGDR